MVFNALRAREQLGSTRLGEGFALPHARIEGLDRFFGMFARLSRPIQFDSVDDRPVDLVFLLLIPMAAQIEHVAALATISRTCETRVSPQNCARRQAPPLWALFFAIGNIPNKSATFLPLVCDGSARGP